MFVCMNKLFQNKETTKWKEMKLKVSSELTCEATGSKMLSIVFVWKTGIFTRVYGVCVWVRTNIWF